jgi:hypothetical protein
MSASTDNLKFPRSIVGLCCDCDDFNVPDNYCRKGIKDF